MARRKGFLSTFRTDSLLQPYILEGITQTGKTLGSGSYGSVIEVKYGQAPCAAKCMHEVLFETGNEGLRETIQKYRRECQLMASLRHPNITQFLGLCFFEGSELPLLVMEKLEMSVNDLLVCSHNPSLSVKLSILSDTCSGLLYLHGMPSPIVHRDLTASNVLLTSHLTAKITDLGNSRMVNIQPGQLAQTLTKSPGTTVYMPPEALSESHKYGPSLDIFSFGHLSLLVLTQKFPILLPPTYEDPKHPGRIMGRSEIERRSKIVKILEGQLNERHSTLVKLVTNCLQNNPTERPSADHVLMTLQLILKEMGDESGAAEKVFSAANLILVKDMRIKNLQLDELKFSEDKLEAELKHLSAKCSNIYDEKRKLELELLQTRAAKDAEINQIKLECQELNKIVQKLAVENEELKREPRKDHRLRGKKSSIIFSQIPFSLKELHWKSGPNMPSGMSGCSQILLIGSTVYVGGGMTLTDEDQFNIMVFSTLSEQWSILPTYDARWFSMTTINSKLILVGGITRDFVITNRLGVWLSDKSIWAKDTLPSMPTARVCSSTCSYKHWLVVAGGYHYDGDLSTVEILDTVSLQWFTGPSTSTPLHSMKSVVIDGTWYLMGGACSESVPQSVYSVSLEALVSQSHSIGIEVWKKLPSLSCSCSCPVVINEALVAIGGEDIESTKPVSTIQRYVYKTNTWEEAGQLPHEVFCLASVVVSNKILVMGGHDEKSHLNIMYAARLS